MTATISPALSDLIDVYAAAVNASTAAYHRLIVAEANAVLAYDSTNPVVIGLARAALAQAQAAYDAAGTDTRAAYDRLVTHPDYADLLDRVAAIRASAA